MVYDSEVMLPFELQYGSPRIQVYQPVEAEQAWQDIIDLLEESRDIGITKINIVPAITPTIPHPEGSPPGLPSKRLSLTSSAYEER
jgi:hypothetical protein